MGWRRMYHKSRLYYVQVLDDLNGFTHIAIKRCDGKPIVATWDVLQSIKNEYAGPDRYAVEVFPDEDSLVYEENMRHLWVFPEGQRLPLSPRWG
jgi:hypothetical protein